VAAFGFERGYLGVGGSGGGAAGGGGGGGGRRDLAQAGGKDPEKLPDIRKALEFLVKGGKVPGVVAVVARNGGIHVAKVLPLSLACDHRVVDGAVGASYLQALRKYMENPALMLV